MRLSIPQPCNESWAAMTPSGNGRHCAACQHTVVDFTQQSDAEILAYLARAAGGRLCGRFAAGQLERPLQRAAPAAPKRWRTWLAAAVAVWGLREAGGSGAVAQQPVEYLQPRLWPVNRPLTATSQNAPNTSHADSLVVRGQVFDSATGKALAGVAVSILVNSVLTDAKGGFRVAMSKRAIGYSWPSIEFRHAGYETLQLDIRAHTGPVLLQAEKLGGAGVKGTKMGKPVVCQPRQIRASWQQARLRLARFFKQ